MQSNGMKELLGDTKSRIIEILLSAPKQAEEIASELNINVSAVRKHLDRLVSSGLALTRFEVRGVGRPKKLFFLTEKGQEILFCTVEQIFLFLLQSITQNQRRVVEESMKEVALKIADTFKGKDDTESVFREKGFHVFEDGNTVVTSSCPVLFLAKEDKRLFCEIFHSELLKRVFNAERVKLVQTMANGSQSCIHKLFKF
jgi:predicted ArsR family transcriptional regulator